MDAIGDAQRMLLLVFSQNILLFVLTVGIFWGGVFVVNRFGGAKGYGLSPLGFRRPRKGVLAGTGLGFVVGVGALLVSFPINALSAYALRLAGRPVETTVQEPFMRGIEGWVAESPAVAIPVAVLVVALVGPAVEELVFRGALFNGAYRLGGLVSRRIRNPRGEKASRVVALVVSAAVTSAFFASLHLDPAIFPAIFLLAVGLCVLYARTGSLLPPVVAHATFNSFAVALIILSGLGVIPAPV